MSGQVAMTYAVVLLAGGAVAVATGIWAVRQTAVSERWVFLGVMLGDMCWAGIATIGIVMRGEWVTVAATYLATATGLTVISLWFVFATLYTGRSLSYRRWQNVAILGSLALAVVGLLTNPLHGYYWSSVTYRTEPFTYAVTTSGPMEVFVYVALYGAVLATLYYLGTLFVKSRHRASTSLLVLVVGTVLASLPNVAMNLGLTPVSGYDHSPLGIAAFVVFAGYAIFGLGMFDIRPIARDNLVDEVDDAFIALDADRHLVDYNAASEPLLAPDETGDPIGRPLTEVFPEVAATLEFDGGEEAGKTDTLSLAHDGETRHYDGRVTPIVEKGSIAGYTVVLTDVTTREEYRQELERRNRQLDQFASAVSHDLRNPLQVAAGQTALLEQRYLSDSDDEAAETVESLARSIDRMEEIVTDLRALSEEGQTVEETEPVEFERTASETWGTIDVPEATLTIDARGRIEAQRSRLRSVLENLFRNAVEHGGPKVSVRVGLTGGGFYVADDGPGIDRENRESVFEYGYSSAANGTGFGLAIVRQMVASHDWDIEVTESETGGARFVVSGAIVHPTDDSTTEAARRTADDTTERTRTE